MTRERLNELLARFPTLRIAVLGDFFLDKYLITDPALSELSVETGLEARQVVAVRCSPGAAGTVTNNLSALGAGTIQAVGVVGDDGEGYELRRGLRETGVTTEHLFAARERFTPTYTKPMVQSEGDERELERLDIKNRTPLPQIWEDRIIVGLQTLLEDGLDAVILLDQVQERNCGVLTDGVRAALAEIAGGYPSVHFFADSRVRIGEFRGVTIKPNRPEAARALHPLATAEPSRAEAEQIARALAARNGKSVYLTLGEEGMLVCTTESIVHIPALPARGPIDIVGAGDSATAGTVCALCAGASPAEAALVGNLCANVTIHKLGTTGTASPDELRERVP